MARNTTKGASCPQATPEALSLLPIITETSHYKLVVFSLEMREEHDTNYGIVNKEYNTIEAMYGVLFAAYELINELQNKLDEHVVSKPTLGLVH